MKPLPLFSNRQIRVLFLLAGAMVFFYILINVLVLGGDAFVFALNSFLVSPLSILTAVLAASLWRQMGEGLKSRLLWGGLSLSWICWAIAETLWAVYSLTGNDPYPSWADFFFLLGYLPMSIGFVSRIVRLPKKPVYLQQLVIWLTSIIVIAVTTFFILTPILQEYDPDLFLESVLGLAYPLGDMLILLLVLNLLFTYGPGDYGLAWRLILLGFITLIISDLLFSYGDWNGLYYPDGKATLFSTLAVDVLYSTSYVLWMLGIYVLRILLREHHTVKIDFQPTIPTNTHVLLFTKRDGTVIEVSENYQHLALLSDPIDRILPQTLGISDQEQRIIHDKLRKEGKLTDFAICMESASGQVRQGWLCALPIVNSPTDASGAIVLLRTFLDFETDHELSEYQRSLVPYVLEKTRSQENNSIRLLFLDYYQAYIISLFNLALREGGAAMSQALLDELQTESRKNGWQLFFNPQTILESRIESPGRLAEALAALVEIAKQFVSRLTDGSTVEREMRKVHTQFEKTVHQTVANLRRSHAV